MVSSNITSLYVGDDIQVYNTLREFIEIDFYPQNDYYDLVVVDENKISEIPVDYSFICVIGNSQDGHKVFIEKNKLHKIKNIYSQIQNIKSQIIKMFDLSLNVRRIWVEKNCYLRT